MPCFGPSPIGVLCFLLLCFAFVLVARGSFCASASCSLVLFASFWLGFLGGVGFAFVLVCAESFCVCVLGLGGCKVVFELDNPRLLRSVLPNIGMKFIIRK